ncbi:MAG: 50S ribosomal protein L18 [Bacteroidota bacterium]
MAIKKLKERRRQKIRFRIRKKVQGTAARPRMVPSISNRRIRIQLIDDAQGKTLLGIAIKGKNIKAALEAGKLIATRAKEKKITNIVFDRGGKRYHGVVKTISQEANKAGLKH